MANFRSTKDLFRLSRDPAANRYFSTQEEQSPNYNRASDPTHESENFLSREKSNTLAREPGEMYGNRTRRRRTPGQGFNKERNWRGVHN